MSRLRVLINFEASDQWDNLTRANIARKSRNLALTSRTFPTFPFETENAARSPQHHNWADREKEICAETAAFFVWKLSETHANTRGIGG